MLHNPSNVRLKRQILKQIVNGNWRMSTNTKISVQYQTHIHMYYPGIKLDSAKSVLSQINCFKYTLHECWIPEAALHNIFVIRYNEKNIWLVFRDNELHKWCTMSFPETVLAKLQYQTFFVLHFISGIIYGFPGHSVRLECGDAITTRREELEWSSDDPDLLLARGVYMDGFLTDASYLNRLADGRAELSMDGSLIIHSYKDGDYGDYTCGSESRHGRTEINTFSMCIRWNVDIWFIVIT